MSTMMFQGCRSCSAVAPLICLALAASSSADEPAANKPILAEVDNANRVEADVDAGDVYTLRALLAANHDLTLSAIQLAANTDLIGADVAQVDDVLRSHLGLGEGKGLVVAGAADDGPAAKAGIQKNDVLITVGGEEISGLEAFRKSLEAAAEKPIALGFIRAGRKQSVEVTPRAAAVARVLAAAVPQTTLDAKYWLRVGLASADDTLRSQLSLPAGEGLVVTNVENDGPAAKAGVMVNDVLLKFDGKALTAIEPLTEQLQAIGDKSVSLELLRRGKPATLTVTPEKRAEPAVLTNLDFLIPAPQRLWIAPQNFNSTWTVAGTAAGNAITFIGAQANPDLARQIGELEAQVKQLEASLAALRSSLEKPAQPTAGGEEKK